MPMQFQAESVKLYGLFQTQRYDDGRTGVFP